MKKTKYRTKLSFKVICMMLGILMVVLNIPISAVAEESPIIENSPPIISESYDSIDLDKLKELGEGELPLLSLQDMKVEDADIPEVIPYAKAVEKGHVNRLYAQEDLSSIIYQNQDGTKTAYLFAKPVKYIDETGATRDKSTKISAYGVSGYGYAMTDNDVKAYFPNNVSNGVLLNYEDYNIKITPAVSGLVVPTYSYNSAENKIIYNNVFGVGTALTYETGLNGIKDDIVLTRNVGKYSFDFRLDTNGLVPQQINGDWYLTDGESIIAVLGDIIVSDSAGKKSMGSLEISALANGYKMTVNVSPDFLASTNTTYPVYVDPSVSIIHIMTDYEDTYTTLIDVGVYNVSSDLSFLDQSNGLLYMGNFSGSGGNGKIIFKMPDFYRFSYGRFTDLSEYQISNVMLNFDIASNNAATINANPMTETFAYDTYGENPFAIYHATLGSAYSNEGATSTSISAAAGVYGINITQIVKGWARYNKGDSTSSHNNPENGLILSLANSNSSVSAFECSNINSITNVVLDYSLTGGESYIYTEDGNYNFIANNNFALSAESFNATLAQEWIFEYIGNGHYYIRSGANPSYYLTDFGMNAELSLYDDFFKDNMTWEIGGTVEAGRLLYNVGSYRYLTVIGNTIGYSTSATNASLWRYCETDTYLPIQDISLSDDWLKPGQTKFFNVRTVPSNTIWKTEKYFTWTIQPSSKVTASTSNPGSLTGVSTGAVTLTLTHKITGFTKSFRIVCGAIREGEYMIQNKGTGRYMDIEGPSIESGAKIQQWDYHTGNQAKWILEISDDGYYYIKSKYSEKYVTVQSITGTGGTLIQTDDSLSDYVKWVVQETNSGAKKLCTAVYTSYVISIPLNEDANGTDLSIVNYTADNNYRDEWIFDNIGETPGIINGGVYDIKSVHSNKYITVENGSMNNGANISQYEYTTEYQWQRWRINYIGNGEYKIQDIHSGSLLSVYGSSAQAQANIHLWEDDGTSGQIFKIRQNEDGTYTFLSKCSNYGKVLDISNFSLENNGNLEQYYDNGTTNQKFMLEESEKGYTVVVVPCVYGKTSQYADIVNFPVYLNNYIERYSSFLNGVTWEVTDNGVITFNPQNMTVTGIETGVAWLDAYKDGKLLLTCYIYVENILSTFDVEDQAYLYLNGTFLGTLSTEYYNIYKKEDPLILRVEWFLYVKKLLNEGKTEQQIRDGLHQKFDVYTNSLQTWQVFYSEMLLGDNGGYTRDRLRLSLDGVYFLLDFYWAQYAAHQLVSINKVNTYTNTTLTEREIIEKRAAAERLCEKDARDELIVKVAKNAQVSGDYTADDFTVVKLKKGTKIYRLCYDADNLSSGRWYTSEKSFLQSNRDYTSIYKGLQVPTDNGLGNRYKIAEYIVNKDVRVAYGIVRNNTDFGNGGYEQYFINDWSDIIGAPSNIYDLINIPTN